MNNLTNRQLAKRLSVTMREWHRATDLVFSLTIDGHNERFSQIVERLGEDHKAVVRYRQADERRNAVEQECRRRLGPDVPAVCFETVLSR